MVYTCIRQEQIFYMEPGSLTSFAAEWIEAWNSHDIDRIMSHYSDGIIFYSPVIIRLGVNAEGVLTDKNGLKAYFQLGLNAYPDLHFEHLNTLAGLASVVLLYKSINGSHAAEYMELNDEGRVTKVVAHYA